MGKGKGGKKKAKADAERGSGTPFTDALRARDGFVLAERVELLLRGDKHLPFPRNELLANRAIGVVPIDQVKKIGRDRHRQFVAGERHPALLLRRERHVALKILTRRQAIFELPGPVLPLLGRHMLPEPLPFKPTGTILGVSHVLAQLGASALAVKRQTSLAQCD